MSTYLYGAFDCMFLSCHVRVIVRGCGFESSCNNVAFKNCAPFTRCVTHINEEHVETAENLDIIMAIYNLIEYSDNMQILLEVYISLKEMNLQ